MSTPELTRDGAIATITLRRPEHANRLGPDDLVAIAEHIDRVNQDERVRVLRLAATGRYFCSGYDIGRLAGAHAVEFEDVANAVEDARPVTLAMIQGGVYGGATDLALACDFRIGTHGIDMFMPAARLGLLFYRRGMQRYVSRLGVDTAKRLFLTAERLTAEEMKATGFLTHLVSPDELAESADTLGRAIAELAPLAVQGMKRHLNDIARGEFDAGRFDTDFARAAQSDDLQEGRAAFAAKRKPLFRGQ